MNKRDYYFVLDVPPISSPEKIRQAYRALSKKYHPDLNPGRREACEVKMKELVEAYSVLTDPDKRKAYDKQPQFQLRRFRKVTRAARPTLPEPQQNVGCLLKLFGWKPHRESARRK